MPNMYPEPPHLSVFVYTGATTPTVWTACADVLQQNGCTPSGEILVAETDTDFKSVSDLERSVITRDGSDQSVPRGHVLLRSAFEHRSFGRVSLGLAPVERLGSVHPIEVAVHAGAFAYPVNLWTKDHRRAAKRLTTWAERLLIALAKATDAPYGAIGIESVFPEPAELAHAVTERGLRPHTWFWSKSLGAAHSAEEERLLSAIPSDSVLRVEGGYILRAWKAGNPADNASIDKLLEFLAVTDCELD